jgi:hypothetical protein
MFLLQDEGTLNLLVRQAELERKLDLPTWMPDWSAEVDKSNNSTRILVRQSLTRYKAALNTRSEIRWPSTIKTLSVKGFLFDDVAILADPVPDNFEMTDNYIEYLENLLNITGSQSQSYIGGGDLPQAIWRLLTMDLTVVHTRRPASSSVQRATTEDYLKSRIAHPPHGVPINIKSFVGVFRFFISRMGYIGLGPVNMRVGDTIHVFLGASVPFVLRQTTQQIAVSGPETEYEYIGNCYVQGIMDGEALYDADLENLGWVNLV